MRTITILIFEMCHVEKAEFRTEFIEHYVGDVNMETVEKDYNIFLKKRKIELSSEYNDGYEDEDFCDEFYEFNYSLFEVEVE